MRFIGLFILASTLATVGCSGNVDEPSDCADMSCDKTSQSVDDGQQLVKQAPAYQEPNDRPSLSEEEKSARRPDRTKLPQ
jgi:hypothetical protein